MKEDALLLAFENAPPPIRSGARFVQHPELQRAGAVIPWTYLSLLGPDAQLPASSAATWELDAIVPCRTGRSEGRETNQILFALNSPAPGEEENYHRWYDEIHISEMLDLVPEFISARRYRLTQLDSGGVADGWSHATVYRIAAPEPGWMDVRMPSVRDSISPLESVAPGHVGWLWSALD